MLIRARTVKKPRIVFDGNSDGIRTQQPTTEDIRTNISSHSKLVSHKEEVVEFIRCRGVECTIQDVLKFLEEKGVKTTNESLRVTLCMWRKEGAKIPRLTPGRKQVEY
ncbi:hypothetical protein HYT84_01350 [Candidatus Micrarchaeota archaeon]|nr:hypothetical protein [Candidatus Micrarchaeota archaeon]